LNSFVQRVRLTRPKVAVPSAGPCTVLDPGMLWMNSDERGIFVDPAVARQALRDSKLPVEPLLMTATDVWDSRTGFESRSPAAFHMPRQQYIAEASERMASGIALARAAESPADSRFPYALPKYFNELVAAQTSATRQRISAKLALDVSGPQGGQWTVDFTSPGREYVRDGILSGWTYKIEVEDKLLWPFISGDEPFFEDLLLSLRFRADRSPNVYNEPLYHFLYEPDPEKLHNWYAKH
jgi:hypothetical protein